MNVTLEGTRNMYVDGASNNEILPSKWRNFKGERRVNPKTNKTINDEGSRNFTLALFIYTNINLEFSVFAQFAYSISTIWPP